MGVFTVEVRLQGPRGAVSVAMTVDSGAMFSKVSPALARQLGLVAVAKDRFELADGRIQIRPIAEARIRVNGREAPTLVVITNGRPLLGALALESLRLGIDPVRKRLRPLRGIPA